MQNNNLERALDWIFSHPESEEECANTSQAIDSEINQNGILTNNDEGPQIKDGNGSKYRPSWHFRQEMNIKLASHILRFTKVNTLVQQLIACSINYSIPFSFLFKFEFGA